MSTSNVLDVRKWIDERPVSPYQWLIVFLSFCIVAMDGFDVAIMGFIAPEIKRIWGVTNQSLGPVLSAALIGLAIGAMVAGPLADYLGRKFILTISVFFFGIWTLAAVTSSDVVHLVIFRFLTGLGLGAAMPNAATLISEFSPEKRRSFLVTVVFCGFTLGAAGGGFLSAWLIPHFGWQSVLVVGGVMPIVLSAFLLLKLPESIRFLVVKNAPAERIGKVLKRISADADVSPNTTFSLGVTTTPANSSAVQLVLSPRYRFGSAMLWGTYFMGLFLVYLMGSWLPTLIKESGYSVSNAAIVTAFFQFGGPAGSLFMGWCMDRSNPHKVLSLTYLVGGILLVGLSMVAHTFALLVLLAFLVGFCLNGANTGMNALSTGFYPTQARATGASWMHGIGRIGAILSAFAGAQMLAWGWSFNQVFVALTVPAALAAVAVWAKGAYGGNPAGQPVSDKAVTTGH